jgi:hypothetical protein
MQTFWVWLFDADHNNEMLICDGKNNVVDVVRKLDIPINARVSVFANVIYPVLNSTTMSFMCKWVTVDNCLLQNTSLLGVFY